MLQREMWVLLLFSVVGWMWVQGQRYLSRGHVGGLGVLCGGQCCSLLRIFAVNFIYFILFYFNASQYMNIK